MTGDSEMIIHAFWCEASGRCVTRAARIVRYTVKKFASLLTEPTVDLDDMSGKGGVVFGTDLKADFPRLP